MTKRERMLKALRHEIPDQVPCCPDISVMIPIRLTRKPYWELFRDDKDGLYYENYSTHKMLKAYLDACKYFNIIAWCFYINPDFNRDDVSYTSNIIEENLNRIVTRTTMHTPEGDLWSETLFSIDNPPTAYRKFIKDFKKQFRFIKYFYPKLDNIDFSPVIQERRLAGDNGVNVLSAFPPSLAHLDAFVDGGLGKLGLIYYDYPELILQYKKLHEDWTIRYLKKIIKSECCDSILTGGSGLMTWQSPKITRDLSLDGLKQITKICKEANLISHLHSCGFEKELVKMCAEETDLDVIEPLETPPQGDCDLKEIKQKYGNKLVLKGNLNTTRFMLSDVKTVEADAIKCIEDAAEGGGFILSTGDETSRDTPHENIFKLVEVCEKYGRY